VTTDGVGTTRERLPVKEGLLSGSLFQLASLRLSGCKCGACGETALGRIHICPNCGSEQVSEIALSDQGVLWSFTVVRHKPPGNFRGPEPFAPFGLGLVELPEGLRVLSPIDCQIDALAIGLQLRFKPVLLTDSQRETVGFAFEPLSQAHAHV
jgi:uncharacterized protein